VVVSGTPKAAGFFQPFKLKFDVDVGNPPPKEPAKRNPWLLVTVAGLIFAAAVAVFYSLKRKAKIKAHKEE
jgi:pyruvate/2-oxoacid:ferredoxin oxidoreductase beta subunit